MTERLSANHFHRVFSVIMGAIMVFIMTFVVTAANVGFPPDFLLYWAKAFAIAYVVAVPVIYFVAPLARRITARFVVPPGQ
jgi:low affinity Fe/Cu permease